VSLNYNHHWSYCSSSSWYMIMERHGGMAWQGKSEEPVENPVSVPLCPPQIPHYSDANLGLRSERPTTNRLSHGMASVCVMLHIHWLCCLTTLIRLQNYIPSNDIGRWSLIMCE
jgi:hypothetical protein